MIKAAVALAEATLSFAIATPEKGTQNIDGFVKLEPPKSKQHTVDCPMKCMYMTTRM